MKKKIIFILAGFILIMAALPGQVMAEEIYTVSDFNGFKNTIENKINTGSPENTYIINLTGDIDFGNSNYNAVFKNHTVILGNGHTINLGRNENYDSLSNSQIAVANGASLSLGKESGDDKLTITASAKIRYKALIAVGDRDLKSILNMYDGVELTGSRVNGATPGSAVNIIKGTFNMRGGKIHNNINEARSSIGGAVVVKTNGKFIMKGGNICNNTTILNNNYGYGGGVFIWGGGFTMTDKATINENKIIKNPESLDKPGLGAGVLLWGGDAILNGGSIEDNESSHLGGGLSVIGDANVTIEPNFSITGNSALAGGGIYNKARIEAKERSILINNKASIEGGGIYNKGTVTVEKGAIIANNEAGEAGDDIAHLDGKITLADAELMNVELTTDGSNKKITGWFNDDDPRWDPNNAKEIDVSEPITEEVFLKAAYGEAEEPESEDVPESENNNFPYWMLFDFNSDLDYKIHQGYFKGYEDLSFRPENKMTREEVAVMFSRLLEGRDLDESIFSQQFSDVESDRWSAAAIRLLSSLDLIKGYPDQTFKPDQTITRAEFLAIAERFKPLNKGDQNFADVPDSHWAYEIVKKAATAAWIQGYPDGSFRPEKEITRAEVVKITNKILDRGADKIFIDKKQETISPYLDLKPDHWAYYNIIEASISHQYIIDKNSGGEVWKKTLDRPTKIFQ
ncbi:MAG: S-layer homology domain-containing protein [Bacillota bacterium]|nr:S-layer homology domain-containing protein [Bacillota bacterium]